MSWFKKNVTPLSPAVEEIRKLAEGQGLTFEEFLVTGVGGAVGKNGVQYLIDTIEDEGSLYVRQEVLEVANRKKSDPNKFREDVDRTVEIKLESQYIPDQEKSDLRQYRRER